MAEIKPFRAIRPNPDFASRVAALPYDVMNSKEARELVKENPYSFLHVDKAEVDLPESISIYDDRVYAKARENLQWLLSERILVQDTNHFLYLYKLTMNGNYQIGVVCCTSVDDYVKSIIKKHELTREEKELDRIKHIEFTNANTGPIFMTYRDSEDNGFVNALMTKWISENKSIYDFVSDDGVRHEIWCIDNQNTINKIVDAFSKLKSLYIADGHHRCAAAAKIGTKIKSNNENNAAEYLYTLSVLFPDTQLRIMDYNRVFADLNELTKEEFLRLVSNVFKITPLNESKKPEWKNIFSMYLDHEWFELELKEKIENNLDPAANLDVTILHERLLKPILGATDPRTDKRIDFVGGIRGLSELTKRVDSGEMAVAFALYPTSISDLMNISDASLLMPPKSTWFEPKLRSGLFIHSLS